MDSHDTSHQFQQTLDRAKTLRDQVRVKLHLGGMDIKDRYNELHTHIEQAELHAKSASQDALHALRDVAHKMEKLAEQLQMHLDAP